MEAMAGEVGEAYTHVTKGGGGEGIDEIAAPSSFSASAVAPTGRRRVGQSATPVAREGGVSGAARRKRLPEFDEATRNDMAKAFAFLDHDETGRIGAAELKIAFEALGKRPSEEELKRIVSHYGKREASLDRSQFFHVMREKMWEEDDADEIARSFVLFSRPDDFLESSLLFPETPQAAAMNQSTLDQLLQETDGISIHDLARAAAICGEDLSLEDMQEMMEEAYLVSGAPTQKRFIPLDEYGQPALLINKEMFEAVMRDGAKSMRQ